jgi:uncharacterized membrane protein
MSAFAYRAGRDIGPFGIVTVIGIAFCALSILAGPVIDRWRNISGAILFYGFGLAFCGAFGMQFIANQGGHYILTFGILVLAVIVGVLAWAWRTDNRSVLWLAYAAFSVEIFALYLKKIGTLLGTSAFFLVAGLILAVLAYIATRMHGAAPARAGGAA